MERKKRKKPKLSPRKQEKKKQNSVEDVWLFLQNMYLISDKKYLHGCGFNCKHKNDSTYIICHSCDKFIWHEKCLLDALN